MLGRKCNVCARVCQNRGDAELGKKPEFMSRIIKQVKVTEREGREGDDGEIVRERERERERK